MDQMGIAVLQPNKVTLDRIRFGAFGGEETSTFDALAGNLAADGFGDEFGEQHLSLHGSIESMLPIEITFDRWSGGRNHNR